MTIPHLISADISRIDNWFVKYALIKRADVTK